MKKISFQILTIGLFGFLLFSAFPVFAKDQIVCSLISKDSTCNLPFDAIEIRKSFIDTVINDLNANFVLKNDVGQPLQLNGNNLLELAQAAGNKLFKIQGINKLYFSRVAAEITNPDLEIVLDVRGKSNSQINFEKTGIGRYDAFNIPKPGAKSLKADASLAIIANRNFIVKNDVILQTHPQAVAAATGCTGNLDSCDDLTALGLGNSSFCTSAGCQMGQCGGTLADNSCNGLDFGQCGAVRDICHWVEDPESQECPFGPPCCAGTISSCSTLSNAWDICLAKGCHSICYGELPNNNCSQFGFDQANCENTNNKCAFDAGQKEEQKNDLIQFTNIIITENSETSKVELKASSTNGAIIGRKTANRDNNGQIISYDGGAIFNQPNNSQLKATGNGGEVGLQGKYISIGNIQAAGYGGLGNWETIGKGGQVTILADEITVGNINVSSTKGLIMAPPPGWDAPEVFGKGGKITVKNALGLVSPTSLKIVGSIYMQAVEPDNELVIKTKEQTWIKGGILAYSGCEPGTEKSVCDYGNLCPAHIPFRTFCQKFYPSTFIDLESDGEGINKGIKVDEGIDVAASGLHNYSNINWLQSSGQGIVRGVKLFAPNSLVYIGGMPSQIVQVNPVFSEFGGYPQVSILAVGFYNQKPLWGVEISGGYVWLDKGIVLDNGGEDINSEGLTVKATPIELALDANVAGWRAGSIVIDSKRRDGYIKIGPISTHGRYPWFSRGGDVEIFSDNQIEAVPVIDWTNPSNSYKKLYIDASGGSFTKSITDPATGEGIHESYISNPGLAPNLARLFRYQKWYVVDGLSEGSTGQCENPNPLSFCDGKTAYYNGTDAGKKGFDPEDLSRGMSMGPDGGDGGHIRISAGIIQGETPPFGMSPGNTGFQQYSLSIFSAGGDGSRGAMGGEGNYCENYQGPKPNIVPKVGTPGEGGSGGMGGQVLLDASRLGCIYTMDLSTAGGFGGSAGGQWGPPFGLESVLSQLASQNRPESDYNYNEFYSGNCNLTNWKGVIMPDIDPDGWTVKGRGGDAGAIVLWLPSDQATGSIKASASGGNAGFFGRAQTAAYPFYCTETKTGAQLIAAEKTLHDAYLNAKTVLDNSAKRAADWANFHHTAALAEFGDQRCCGFKAVDEIHYNNYEQDCAGCENRPYGGSGAGIVPNDCYTWANFQTSCRSKIVQTPCQTKGFAFNNTEGFYGQDFHLVGKNNDFLKIQTTKPGVKAFSGLLGKKGGDGGWVRIDSLLRGDLGQIAIINTNGGNGSPGGPGQNTSADNVNKPGNGGPGGNGSKAGNIEITNPALWLPPLPGQIMPIGGAGGVGGDAGKQIIALPIANFFCGRNCGGTVCAEMPFADYNTNEGEQSCSAPEELQSCRTENDKMVEPGAFIGFADNSAERGTDGLPGLNLQIFRIPPALPSLPGFSCLAGGVPTIVEPYWQDEQNCCDGVDDDGNGRTDCKDSACEDSCFGPAGLVMNRAEKPIERCNVNLCEDWYDNDFDEQIDYDDPTDCLNCGDKVFDAFSEECGEPGASACPAGETCHICQCISDNPPTVSDLEIPTGFPAYCQDDPEGNRAGRLELRWLYQDPEQDPISRFELQIASNGNWDNPKVEEDISGLSDASGTQKIRTFWIVTPTRSGKLDFNTIYNWRVKVYDSNGNPSDWQYGPDFTTLKHPWPKPEFTWWLTPEPGKPVNFINQAVFYDGFISYAWTFENGDPATSTDEHPQGVVFSTAGPKTVSLEARDSDGYACIVSHQINIVLFAPKWEETAP